MYVHRPGAKQIAACFQVDQSASYTRNQDLGATAIYYVGVI